MYVEELIGPDTVNTVPPKTLKAFLDHGKVEITIDQGLDEAKKVFDDLIGYGIDLDEVTAELESEGVKSFAAAYASLLDSLQERMKEFTS
jgi:transaldolase